MLPDFSSYFISLFLTTPGFQADTLRSQHLSHSAPQTTSVHNMSFVPAQTGNTLADEAANMSKVISYMQKSTPKELMTILEDSLPYHQNYIEYLKQIKHNDTSEMIHSHLQSVHKYSHLLYILNVRYVQEALKSERDSIVKSELESRLEKICQLIPPAEYMSLHEATLSLLETNIERS